MNMPFSKKFILFVFCSFLFLNGCNNTSSVEEENKMVGVKIYDYSKNLSGLFEEWGQLGINTVFTNEKLLGIEGFTDLAQQHRIKTFIITPVFFNDELLAAEPEYYAITNKGEHANDDWVKFVCPSRKDYRKQKIESIKSLVLKFEPDGISIDFIRHFVFWETIYPDRALSSIDNTCFDESCLSHFQEETNWVIPTTLKTEMEKANWITENCFDKWVEWKCGLITSMVEEITNEVREIEPDILINVHLVPWRDNDFNGAIRKIAGQDFKQLAPIVDYLSPMTYAHMVKQQPEWVNSVVQDVYNKTQGIVIPCIQVKEAYLSDTLSIDEFRNNLQAALKPPSKGVLFWSWEQLDIDVNKKQVIKNIIKGD